MEMSLSLEGLSEEALVHRHPSTLHMARMLRPNVNLRGEFLIISQMCAELAADMIETLDDSPELTAGLRKLLEAKDAFVRCAVLKAQGPEMNVDYRDR